MNLVVFEDSLADQLHPANTGRPTYAITIGSFRLIDWLRQLEHRLVGWVRPYLFEIQAADYPDVDNQVDLRQDWSLLVNARIVPSPAAFQVLKLIAKRQAPCVMQSETETFVALLPTSYLRSMATTPSTGTMANSVFSDPSLKRILASVDPPPQALPIQLETVQHPHQLVQSQLKIIGQCLQHRLDGGRFQQLQDGLFVGQGVQLPRDYVVNAKNGPVLIDDGASLGPYTYLAGPVYIGPKSKIIEHSSIKDAVCLGHTTKVGGEVEASIVEPYTNKQHHGFLGHSYVGSWVNLGAGTCNSDLKNTYGEVKMEYAYGKINTGSQFVGCLVGDYSKSAINTSIFTGKLIGVCSMVYGFVTTNVPSFVNYARHFGQVTEMGPNVMVATQARMFARRQVTQRECDIKLIHDMHERTRRERLLSEEPLSL
ncbi:MAG: putative sugar nucleotidyl transferase [Pirellulaceae bacterium]|nr:putative sugar nucleotidyl transferase [Pirellulaceae bacterium]